MRATCRLVSAAPQIPALTFQDDRMESSSRTAHPVPSGARLAAVNASDVAFLRSSSRPVLLALFARELACARASPSSLSHHPSLSSSKEDDGWTSSREGVAAGAVTVTVLDSVTVLVSPPPQDASARTTAQPRAEIKGGRCIRTP